MVPAGGRAVPDAARGQRHADEAAVPFPATPGRARRARQGAQGAQPHARACPGQGRRCRHCATARLWPLAALVTGETRGRPPSPEDKRAWAFLWRGKSLPIGCAASGLDAPLLRKALSPGWPASRRVILRECVQSPCHLGQSGPIFCQMSDPMGLLYVCISASDFWEVPTAGVL